jgi:hypothetical protein
MKALAKASRINAITQVIQHMNSGMTMVEVFREEGMLNSLYYFGLHNLEAIADIQAILDRSNRN